MSSPPQQPGIALRAVAWVLVFLAEVPQSVYALLLFATLLFWHLGGIDARPVNPAALETFRVIVEQCEAETFPFETQRCRDVLYIADYCRTRRRTACTAEAFYRAMERMGFILPPLREEVP